MERRHRKAIVLQRFHQTCKSYSVLKCWNWLIKSSKLHNLESKQLFSTILRLFSSYTIVTSSLTQSTGIAFNNSKSKKTKDIFASSSHSQFLWTHFQPKPRCLPSSSWAAAETLFSFFLSFFEQNFDRWMQPT